MQPRVRDGASLVWHQVTDEWPPTVTPTAKNDTKAGLPWFEYYADELDALNGSAMLKNLKSVSQMAKKKGPLLPQNEALSPDHIVKISAGLKPGQVRQ